MSFDYHIEKFTSLKTKTYRTLVSKLNIKRSLKIIIIIFLLFIIIIAKSKNLIIADFSCIRE